MSRPERAFQVRAMATRSPAVVDSDQAEKRLWFFGIVDFWLGSTGPQGLAAPPGDLGHLQEIGLFLAYNIARKREEVQR